MFSFGAKFSVPTLTWEKQFRSHPSRSVLKNSLTRLERYIANIAWLDLWLAKKTCKNIGPDGLVKNCSVDDGKLKTNEKPWKLTINRKKTITSKKIVNKDPPSSLQISVKIRYQGTKPNDRLRRSTDIPMKQEMETDDDHATMRESFSLVHNILFIDYTDVLPAY